VSDNLPLVTVIIPTRPGQPEIKALASCRRLDYPKERLEIIIARGKQPAVQRNAALNAAHGEFIYFLDDDSVPQTDNLRRAIPRFSDPAVVMVGGPSLCPPDAPNLEKIFAVVLSSWLAFGPSRARYEPVGKVRATSEKELILCNQLARREALLAAGGFPEALYPNEENALMDDLQKRGGKLIYDPDLIAYRRPRPTLKSFCKMLLTYGRGRAEQFRLNPTLGSALNFVPPLFCLYLLLLPLLLLVIQGSRFKVQGSEFVMLLPLWIYGLAVLAQTTRSANAKGWSRSLAAMPFIVLTHLLYGLGFWHGLFTRLKKPGEKPSTEVSLETISL
jgi:cellulose synthase/poly-beta-1,6-N-acetylglucosamine synthase-like glycosyltransferase